MEPGLDSPNKTDFKFDYGKPKERAFFGDSFHGKISLPSYAKEFNQNLYLDINKITSEEFVDNREAIEEAKDAAINEKEFFRCIVYAIKANLPQV